MSPTMSEADKREFKAASTRQRSIAEKDIGDRKTRYRSGHCHSSENTHRGTASRAQRELPNEIWRRSFIDVIATRQVSCLVQCQIINLLTFFTTCSLPSDRCNARQAGRSRGVALACRSRVSRRQMRLVSERRCPGESGGALAISAAIGRPATMTRSPRKGQAQSPADLTDDQKKGTRDQVGVIVEDA